jgi:hypothetical protein
MANKQQPADRVHGALPCSDWLQVLALAAFVIVLLLMRIEPGHARTGATTDDVASSSAPVIDHSEVATAGR